MIPLLLVTGLELLLLCAAGACAGAINGAVGSGSLLTLPVLLWLGVDPAVAVPTNTIAMVSSAFGGALVYRQQLRTERQHIRHLLGISLFGGVVGALLLLTTSSQTIRVVVPVLIVFALVLVVCQPAVGRWVNRRANAKTGPLPQANPYGAKGLGWSVLGCSLYGGYFVAAQGVLLLGVLGAFTGREMRQVNGVKNALTLTVNTVAGVVFTCAYFTGHAQILWQVVGVMMLGAVVGGYAGGKFAQRVPPVVLRGLIVLVGVTALLNELL